VDEAGSAVRDLLLVVLASSATMVSEGRLSDRALSFMEAWKAFEISSSSKVSIEP